MSLRVGVDLGGTNIAVGVVDDSYNIVRKLSVSTDPTSADSVADGIADAVRALLDKLGLTLDDVDGIGIGAPGIVDAEHGVIDYVCNLPMVYYPLGKAVADRLGVSERFIKLENDASAAALGEVLAGAGKGARDFMLITLGTGVGGGVIADGKILSSFNHAGGELGHTVIVVGGEPCGCGRRGCAEAYCSATALVRMAREASLPSVTGAKDVFDAARSGDEAVKTAAKAVLDSYFEYVATMLANFINIFQPEIIAVGGGVSGAGDDLIKPLRERIFPDMIYNRNQPKELHTRLCTATLGGDAGIIGAAML